MKEAISKYVFISRAHYAKIVYAGAYQASRKLKKVLSIFSSETFSCVVDNLG
jgi:hypothetical protein